MEPASYLPVCDFPASENHRAQNLADRLEEDEIEPHLLYADGLVVVAVPCSQLSEALQISERFLENYEAELETLAARSLDPSFSERTFFWIYAAIIPGLLSWFSVSNIWKALTFQGTSRTPYLSSWRDSDLGAGIAGLLIVAVYVAGLVYVRRKIRKDSL